MAPWYRKAKITLARKPCRGQGPVPDRSVLLCANLEFSVPASRKAVNSEPCSQTQACRLPNASPGGGPGNGRDYMQTPAPMHAQPGFGWRARVVCARAWTACQGACLPLLSPRRLSREIDVVHCDLRRTWSVNGTRIQLQRYITTKLRSCQTLHPYRERLGAFQRSGYLLQALSSRVIHGGCRHSSGNDTQVCHCELIHGGSHHSSWNDTPIVIARPRPLLARSKQSPSGQRETASLALAVTEPVSLVAE